MYSYSNYRRSQSRAQPRRYTPYVPITGRGAYRVGRRTLARPTIRGRGAYTYDNPGPWGRAGESVGSLIGSSYAGGVGKYLLGKAGRYVGHKVGRLFGSGAYGVTTDTAVMAPDPPKFSNNRSDDSVVITHREYLGDIITSSSAGGFNIESYGLNPSEKNTFPWLSAIAQPNYQQYKFDGLVFEFRSFSADALNSTNTALGSVFACINYDYMDQDPASRYEVENTDWSKSAKPSESFMIPVECATKQTSGNGFSYIINGNNIPPNTDPKTYYLGKLWIGTTGFQGTSVNVGSLYVTYKIRLYKPVMTRPLSNALVYQSARAGATTGALWGSSQLSAGQNCDSIGVTISGNVLTMSHKRLIIGQRFLVAMTITGGSNAAAAAPTPSISGGVGYNYFSDVNAYDATLCNFPPTTSTQTKVGQFYVFEVTRNTQDLTITLSGGGYPVSPILQLGIFEICGTAISSIGTYIP